MKKGQKYKNGERLPVQNGDYIKIMAYADGYYMARYKGCVPFCFTEKEIEARLI